MKSIFNALAPLFTASVTPWLTRPGYEKHVATVIGGDKAATRDDQHLWDIRHRDKLIELKRVSGKRQFTWLDTLRTFEAVESGLNIVYTFVLCDETGIGGALTLPAVDVLTLLGLNPTFAADAIAYRDHTPVIGGQHLSKQHKHLHCAIRIADLLLACANTSGAFTGEGTLLIRSDWLHRFPAELLKHITVWVFDPQARRWQ